MSVQLRTQQGGLGPQAAAGRNGEGGAQEHGRRLLDRHKALHVRRVPR